MKNVSGKKIAYVLIAAVFIVILCLGIMSRLNIIGKDNSAYENSTILSSWSSEPIGKAGYYVTVESIKSNSHDSFMCFFNTLENKSKKETSFGRTTEQLKNLTYDEIDGSIPLLEDYENNIVFFATFVPSDCEYLILNKDNKYETQDVELKAADENIKFKMCIGTVNLEEFKKFEEENIVSSVVYIDENGNSHDCSEKLDEYDE